MPPRRAIKPDDLPPPLALPVKGVRTGLPPPPLRKSAQAPDPGGKHPYEAFALRVVLFKTFVLSRDPAKVKAFLAKWPTFPDAANFSTWSDADTLKAKAFFREAFGTDIPEQVRPLLWEEVKAERTQAEAAVWQAKLQRDHGNAQRLDIGIQSPEPRHYNDLNTMIFHDARDVIARPKEAVTFLFEHEIGHRVFYPGDHVRRAYGQALMDMYGGGAGRWRSGKPSVNYPGKTIDNLFLNWLGDQIINYRMQYTGPERDQFGQGMRWTLRYDRGYGEGTGMNWFFKMHFRLLWASSVMRLGYPDAGSKGGWHPPPSRVGLIPEVLTIESRDFPMVTFDDGPEWLWKGTRLPALWEAINLKDPGVVEDNMKSIMELSEPFFFEPSLPNVKNATPTNPDGVMCPACKTSDKMFRMKGTMRDARDGKEKPRYGCNRCQIHKDMGQRGVYAFDRGSAQVRKVAASTEGVL